jgi:hypothetical protein
MRSRMPVSLAVSDDCTSIASFRSHRKVFLLFALDQFRRLNSMYVCPGSLADIPRYGKGCDEVVVLLS